MTPPDPRSDAVPRQFPLHQVAVRRVAVATPVPGQHLVRSPSSGVTGHRCDPLPSAQCGTERIGGPASEIVAVTAATHNADGVALCAIPKGRRGRSGGVNLANSDPCQQQQHDHSCNPGVRPAPRRRTGVQRVDRRQAVRGADVSGVAAQTTPACSSRGRGAPVCDPGGGAAACQHRVGQSCLGARCGGWWQTLGHLARDPGPKGVAAAESRIQKALTATDQEGKMSLSCFGARLR